MNKADLAAKIDQAYRDYLAKVGFVSTLLVTHGLAEAIAEALQPAEPETWNGEGLPPVGLKVEIYEGPEIEWLESQVYLIGKQVTVLTRYQNSIGRHIVVVELEDNSTVSLIPEVLRPIRTAEQIAADERQKAIEGLGTFLSANCSIPTPYLWEAAQKIYDAGYRKVDQ